jgi:hypothetical protein
MVHAIGITVLTVVTSAIARLLADEFKAWNPKVTGFIVHPAIELGRRLAERMSLGSAAMPQASGISPVGVSPLMAFSTKATRRRVPSSTHCVLCTLPHKIWLFPYTDPVMTMVKQSQ